MAATRADPQAVRTIPRPLPHIAAAPPPLIGVVTHELRGEAEPAWAPAPGRAARDLAPHRLALRLTYTQAIQEAGGIAVVVPAHGYVDDTDALLDRLDGLVFSGGPDLDPAVYGQARHPQLGPDVDRVSDEYELALLAGAAERDLPMLGICRGMQALNVSRGGTLHQHLPDRTALDHRQSHAPFEPIHPVSVTTGSLLHQLARSSRLEVNSYHHQAVDRLGGGLQACASAADATIEAVWDPSARFCLGVQWHPEVLTHQLDQAALFERLVLAARGRPALTLALAA
jgi:putative glutamine amidotransferase